MAKIRRAGFGTVFEVENETIGIGTTGTTTNTVQVLGNIESSNANVVTQAQLENYQGFLSNETRLSDNDPDLNKLVGYVNGEAYYGAFHVHNRDDGSVVNMVGAAHTTSTHNVIDASSNIQSGTMGDIIIDGNFTVSSGTTYCSSVDELTLTTGFAVPTGTTDDRIHCHTAGSMRFNEDLGTLEFYTGDEWKTVRSFTDAGNRGRAIIAGGENTGAGTDYKIIEYIQTSTLGNSTKFGDLTNTNMQNPAGLSNSIRALFGGGQPTTATIDYITIASEGNGVDFGDLSAGRPRASGLSNSNRGIFIGGNPGVNIMDYVQIMTTGNALDFGDLSFNGQGPSAAASPTRGIITNDYSASLSIDQITIASTGNGVSFGEDLFYGGYGGNNGASTGTRGIWMGGYTSNQPLSPSNDPRRTTSIRGVDFASGGKAVEYGNLMSLSYAVYGSSTGTKNRGFYFGGFAHPLNPSVRATNVIQFMNTQTSGDAQDFGDLCLPRYSIGSACDSHGGLGGY